MSLMACYYDSLITIIIIIIIIIIINEELYSVSGSEVSV
jgi:hypothetical protein